MQQIKIINSIIDVVPDVTIRHELKKLHDEHGYAIQLAETKYSIDQKDNTYSPNVRFLSGIVQRLFTWLYVNRQDSNTILAK